MTSFFIMLVVFPGIAIGVYLVGSGLERLIRHLADRTTTVGKRD